MGHAHNDYEHQHPLNDALAAGFTSVEADIWLRDGELVVSHDAFTQKGTLADLYLDPLQALVDAHGSVHNDGAPFTLWIDIKDQSAGLNDALATLLGKHAMIGGAVVVILTGDAAQKQAFRGPVTIDSNDFSLSDPSADGFWRSYALDWNTYNPTAERMACIVNVAHQKGRSVRFFGGPDDDAAWKQQRDANVDFINTDKLTDLAAFLAR